MKIKPLKSERKVPLSFPIFLLTPFFGSDIVNKNGFDKKSCQKDKISCQNERGGWNAIGKSFEGTPGQAGRESE